MRNIAKIALIIFVSMLEVGYTDDCRKELFEKYKAHSAEFIKLKNKCKPLLEKVGRLAETYSNRVEYKEYEAIKLQYEKVKEPKWLLSAEYREAEMKFDKCLSSEAITKRLKELSISYKTQIKAYEQAEEATTLEINATCKLFLDGVYDIDRAFERIARADDKFDKAISNPQWMAYAKERRRVRGVCSKIIDNSAREYFAEYDKALKAAEKALEPLQTAFRNSQEVKEYEAECRGITTYSNMELSDLFVEWYWDYVKENRIISYIIKSIIVNRP